MSNSNKSKTPIEAALRLTQIQHELKALEFYSRKPSWQIWNEKAILLNEQRYLESIAPKPLEVGEYQ